MKLLIPLSYLNETCNLSKNIDEKEFKMHLTEAQIALRDILGPEFYEEIEAQYLPQDDTFTSDNSTLYENYLKDFLAWRAYFEYLGFSQSQSTPTGFREQNDPNSSILDGIKLASKEKNVLNRVNRRKYDIINYLKLEQSKNSSKFPLWKEPCSTEFSFAISSIERDSRGDNVISVNKAVINNE